MQNKLYYGDNLDVLREHIPSESIDLIYLDPPFNSNRNYFVLFKDRTGSASAAQEEAFMDTWTWTETSERTYRELITECSNQDLATLIGALRACLRETPMMAYIVAMAIRLLELYRILKPTGSLYLHCDPTASHYLKIVLDAIFGAQNFRTEITWKRQSAHNDAKQGRKAYGNIADIILYYTKSSAFTFNTQHTAYDPQYIQDFYKHIESETGRRYRLSDLTAAKPGGDTKYEWIGPSGIAVRPYGNRSWAYSKENMQRFEEEGRLVYSKTGMPSYKRYLDEMPGVALQSIWDDIKPATGQETLGYPTQKPIALLERIVSTSSNPDEIILDPFCGCGTTVTAAHKLGRHWIGIDITGVAIGVIKARLESSFDDLRGKLHIEGMPRDFEGARILFEADPHQFQIWACIQINAYPLQKKGADRGIDGWLRFLDYDDAQHACPVQVKGGKVQVSQIRDFCHVVDREKAPLGFFLCMGDVTRPMKEEALKMGLWQSYSGHQYPRVQIISIEDLLAHKDGPRYPAQDKNSILGFKAQKQQRVGIQKSLF